MKPKTQNPKLKTRNSKLLTTPRIPDPDTFYKALADLHEGRTAEESLLINSKLILLLANHIGELDVLLEAIGVISEQAAVGSRQ